MSVNLPAAVNLPARFLHADFLKQAKHMEYFGIRETFTVNWLSWAQDQLWLPKNAGLNSELEPNFPFVIPAKTLTIL